jgi:hypothetical protein
MADPTARVSTTGMNKNLPLLQRKTQKIGNPAAVAEENEKKKNDM